MKKFKMVLIIIVIIALIHLLPLIYTDRIPVQTSNPAKIPGMLAIDIAGSDYKYYFVLEGSLSVSEKEKGVWEGDTFRINNKYKKIIDIIFEERKKLDSISKHQITLLKKETRTLLTVDSVIISPTGRYALRIGESWVREILDMTTGEVIVRVPTLYQTHPDAYSWSKSGECFAISLPDTIQKDGEYGLVITNLSTMNKIFKRFENPIEAITWSPDSKSIAVVTQSVRYAYCPINLLLRLGGHNILYYSYYLTILNVEADLIYETDILKDTRRGCCTEIYWME